MAEAIEGACGEGYDKGRRDAVEELREWTKDGRGIPVGQLFAISGKLDEMEMAEVPADSIVSDLKEMHAALVAKFDDWPADELDEIAAWARGLVDVAVACKRGKVEDVPDLWREQVERAFAVLAKALAKITAGACADDWRPLVDGDGRGGGQVESSVRGLRRDSQGARRSGADSGGRRVSNRCRHRAACRTGLGDPQA